MDMYGDVYGARATAQQDKALALSRKCVWFNAARMG